MEEIGPVLDSVQWENGPGDRRVRSTIQWFSLSRGKVTRSISLADWAEAAGGAAADFFTHTPPFNQWFGISARQGRTGVDTCPKPTQNRPIVFFENRESAILP